MVLAPGYRYYRTGVQDNIGSCGCGWFSMASNTHSMALSSGVAWLYPSNENPRGYGFPLRCLSE